MIGRTMPMALVGGGLVIRNVGAVGLLRACLQLSMVAVRVAMVGRLLMTAESSEGAMRAVAIATTIAVVTYRETPRQQKMAGVGSADLAVRIVRRLRRLTMVAVTGSG